MKRKKGLGSVIAAVLIIVVAVVSVVGFQSFYGSFQSSAQNKAESKFSDMSILSINHLSSGSNARIFVNNPSSNYAILEFVKLNGVDCELLASDILGQNTVTEILVSCPLMRGATTEVVLGTYYGVFEETHIAR